jgi:hypothetical protein
VVKNLPYREGAAFSVPLQDGGFALGIVARMAPKGKVLLGYFFGPRQDTPDFDLRSLSADAALLVGRFGDLHLVDGKWRIVGQLPDWNRSRWPVPPFLWRDPLGFLPDRVVIYDEDDLAKLGKCERRDVIPPGIPEDGLMGAGFVETKLNTVMG